MSECQNRGFMKGAPFTGTALSPTPPSTSVALPCTSTHKCGTFMLSDIPVDYLSKMLILKSQNLFPNHFKV